MFEECFKKYNWTNNHGVILGMCDNQSSDSIHLKGFYPNPRRPAEFMSMQIMLKWSLMYVLWFFFFGKRSLLGLELFVPIFRKILSLFFF